MKTDIHPAYKVIKVSCSCGNSFQVGSTMDIDELKIEICSKCHPFFTGEQKLVDTQRTVEKFEKKLKVAESKKTQLEASKKKKEERVQKKREQRKNDLAKEIGIKDLSKILGQNQSDTAQVEKDDINNSQGIKKD